MPKSYILNYRKFLLEQDLGMPGAVGMPGMPEAPKKEKPLFFIFIDDMDEKSLKRKKYPDGSSAVDFPTYSLLPSEIEDWSKKNVLSVGKNDISNNELDVRRKNIVEIVRGEKTNVSSDDIPFVQKLKNAVSTDIFGKREPDTTVIFTNHGVPTTEDIKVTFIRCKK